MKDIYYRVADLVFCVSLSDGIDTDNFLPSFVPFFHNYEGGEILFQLNVHPELHSVIMEEYELIDNSINDMGRVLLYSSDCYYSIRISFRDDEMMHYAVVDKGFSVMDAYINMSDINAGSVVCSLLRIVFSQAVIMHDGISLHASCVVLDGKAYMFMGKSGTGKSTHSRLWMNNFEGCELLNDDNPVIRIADSCVMVYGTPWSGKTPCYKNRKYPVKGIVRLKQSDNNRFIICVNTDAFVTLLPGCSVIKKDEILYDRFCDVLSLISGMIIVGKLDCLPDNDAALLCKSKLMVTEKNYDNE